MLDWDAPERILSAHSDSSTTSVEFNLTEHYPPSLKQTSSFTLPVLIPANDSCSHLKATKSQEQALFPPVPALHLVLPLRAPGFVTGKRSGRIYRA